MQTLFSNVVCVEFYQHFVIHANKPSVMVEIYLHKLSSVLKKNAPKQLVYQRRTAVEHRPLHMSSRANCCHN